jgi:hypothetical protein
MRQPEPNGKRINIGAYGNTETASKAPPLLYTQPFTLVNPFTGSTRFTNSNGVEVIALPLPADTDHYQITPSANRAAVNDNEWVDTTIWPSPLSFECPTADTNIHFYAWFTNRSVAVTLRRSEAIIRYTTEKPVPLALKTYDRTLYPGMPVVISPDEINAGSTGGITGGESIPIYTKHLNLVSGPGENTTPDTPEVTVAQPGDYTLELVVVNDAGNIATSKLCTVTVFVVYPPAVTNSGATAWGHSSAILHGEVLDIGGDTPITRFDYWLTAPSH